MKKLTKGIEEWVGGSDIIPKKLSFFNALPYSYHIIDYILIFHFCDTLFVNLF